MTTSHLEIRLFGNIEVRVDGQLLNIAEKKAQWLVGLLALQIGRSVERISVAKKLWPEPECINKQRKHPHDSRLLLRKCLYEQLKGLPGLETNRTHIRLLPDNVWVDVLEFDKAIAEGVVEGIERAVTLYSGALMESCGELWIEEERRFREERYLQALEKLAKAETDRGASSAVPYLCRLIQVDPLRESAHRNLMRTYAKNGDYPKVDEAFHALCETLAKDYSNNLPDAETRTLYDQLRKQAQQRPPVPQQESSLIYLPSQANRLIGRVANIQEVQYRFQDTRRLVTLTGTGGVGKTRLAIAVAEEMKTECPDGVWFVDLAPLTKPSQIFQAVKKAVKRNTLLSKKSNIDEKEVLVQMLNFGRQLLILDNCEHLTEGCAELVEYLISQCNGLRILATSRRRLGIAVESIYNVRSLILPRIAEYEKAERGDQSAADSLQQYTAIKLFLERAKDRGVNTRPSAQEMVAIAEICMYVEGIPLAIELAAGRLSTLSVYQVRDKLKVQIFDLLVDRRTVKRQQTLWATLEWSYNLLSDTEQTLLSRLAVFQGGWTLEAAENIFVFERALEDGITTETVMNLLANLEEQALVQVENENGKVRYRLLEAVRQFATHKFKIDVEADLIKNQHRNYFLNLFNKAVMDVGLEQEKWLECLDEEYANVNGALEWCWHNGGSAETGLQVVCALDRFWRSRGYLAEGRTHLAHGLENFKNRTTQRARALNMAGALAHLQGEYKQALERHNESLGIYMELNDNQGTARTLYWLGIVTREMGDYRQAIELHRDNLERFINLDDQASTASTLHQLGLLAKDIAEDRADLLMAQHYFEQSLSIYRDLKNNEAISQLLQSLGLLASLQGLNSLARGYYEESLQIRTNLKNLDGLANLHIEIGNLYLNESDFEHAERHYQNGLELFEKLSQRRGIAICKGNIGDVAYYLGDNARAWNLIQESLKIFTECGDRFNIARLHDSLSNVARDRGDYVQAQRYNSISQSMFTNIDVALGIAVAYSGAGKLEIEQGNYGSALALLRKSLEMLRDLNNKNGVVGVVNDYTLLIFTQRRNFHNARLVAWALALREKYPAPLTPKDQMKIREDINVVKAMLGDEEFAAVWNEGIQMELEQVVECVLQCSLHDESSVNTRPI